MFCERTTFFSGECNSFAREHKCFASKCNFSPGERGFASDYNVSQGKAMLLQANAKTLKYNFLPSHIFSVTMFPDRLCTLTAALSDKDIIHSPHSTPHCPLLRLHCCSRTSHWRLTQCSSACLHLSEGPLPLPDTHAYVTKTSCFPACITKIIIDVAPVCGTSWHTPLGSRPPLVYPVYGTERPSSSTWCLPWGCALKHTHAH